MLSGMVSAFARGRTTSSSGAQPLLPLDKDNNPRADPGKTFRFPTSRLFATRTARTIRRLYLRTRTLLLAIFIVWNILDVVQVRRHLQPSLQDDIPPHKNIERIFIASNHWNDELVLRNHWISAVLNLAEHLGPHNSFISIVESGSYDDTKGALRYLDAELEKAGVGRAIVLDETTHAQDIAQPPGDGWVMTPNGTAQLRRIPYLSKQRNLALKPLYEMAAEGNRFDKILFLNDVVFSDRDIDNLLSTNNGEYAAACSLDFSKPPAFYDTFVLRDSEDHEALMPTWPYFRSRTSRKAMKSNRPVPVTSCWNGMVIMDATPFYAQHNPLVFRGLPDSLAQSHLEASECCLIHTDNPLSPTKGVWVNPSVRVGYSGLAYEKVQSSAYLAWLSPLRIFVRLWENRLRRWTTTTWFKERYVRGVVRGWEKAGKGRVESGEACTVNEMQILTWYGWKHV